jgi:hypothetical protein
MGRSTKSGKYFGVQQDSKSPFVLVRILPYIEKEDFQDGPVGTLQIYCIMCISGKLWSIFSYEDGWGQIRALLGLIKKVSQSGGRVKNKYTYHSQRARK